MCPDASCVVLMGIRRPYSFVVGAEVVGAEVGGATQEMKFPEPQVPAGHTPHVKERQEWGLTDRVLDTIHHQRSTSLSHGRH